MGYNRGKLSASILDIFSTGRAPRGAPSRALELAIQRGSTKLRVGASEKMHAVLHHRSVSSNRVTQEICSVLQYTPGRNRAPRRGGETGPGTRTARGSQKMEAIGKLTGGLRTTSTIVLMIIGVAPRSFRAYLIRNCQEQSKPYRPRPNAEKVSRANC